MTRSFLLASVIFATACNNNAAHHQITENTQQQVEPSIKSTSNSPLFDAVYAQYLELSEALVIEDEAAAKKASNAIAAAFNEAGKNTEAKMAEKIIDAGNIDAKRTSFHALSNVMIEWAKNEKLTSGNIYVAHCPMAFNDTGGSWLTSKKEIRNPYYGDAMLKCGSITETLH